MGLCPTAKAACASGVSRGRLHVYVKEPLDLASELLTQWSGHDHEACECSAFLNHGQVSSERFHAGSNLWWNSSAGMAYAVPEMQPR